MVYCPMSHDINVYAFLLTFVPTLAILAKIKNALPANMVDAANMIAYLKPPLSCEISAPAMGVPVKVAKLITLQIRTKSSWVYLNIIPILTPILLISLGSVSAPTPAGGKLTSVPEKKPYNIANTMNPCHVDTPSQPNRSVPDAITVGIRILIGPATSAMKFGNIRPKTDAAYD